MDGALQGFGGARERFKCPMSDCDHFFSASLGGVRLAQLGAQAINLCAQCVVVGATTTVLPTPFLAPTASSAGL